MLRVLQRVKYVRTAVTSLLYFTLLPARVSRADVVHLYSASYMSFLLAATPALLVARALRKPVILNYHSGDAESHLQQWRRTAVDTMRLADEIVVSSGFLAKVFAKFGLRARVLPSPIDLSRFEFREREPLRPRFLTSRLLEPIYNVSCVLRAFALIQKQHPEARLIVAGEGTQRRHLESLARELSLRNVEFVGRVPPDRLPQLCRDSDVYLSATDVDNVPSSLIEAMASGMPVVTTDAGGIPYLFAHERTCLMVRRGDYEQLATQSLRLLSSPELVMAITSRARGAGAEFEWSHVRSDWLALYVTLAEGRRRRRPAPSLPVAEFTGSRTSVHE